MKQFNPYKPLLTAFAILLFLQCCQPPRVLRSTRGGVDIHNPHIRVRNSQNVNIYILNDSIHFDTITKSQ